MSVSEESYNFIRQVTNIIQSVTDESETLQKTATQVDQLNRAIENIAEGAHEQAQEVQKVTIAVADISAAIDQISQNAESSAAVGKKNAATAYQGANTVQQAVEAMHAIKVVVSDTGEKVQQMAHHSAQIGAIIGVFIDSAKNPTLRVQFI